MEISGIMHVHSKYSYDGEMSIKQIKELCKSRGNHFVFITEHLESMSKKEMENFVS